MTRFQFSYYFYCFTSLLMRVCFFIIVRVRLLVKVAGTFIRSMFNFPLIVPKYSKNISHRRGCVGSRRPLNRITRSVN